MKNVMATPANRPHHNVELAAMFHQMALCYRYLGNEHRFRAMAYDVASRTVSGLKDDIAVYATDIDTLDKLNGIGQSIGGKIMEYLATGKIRTFERLKKRVPEGLLELMEIKGFGPATVRHIHEALHVNNREGVMEAIESGSLEQIKGFGSKRIENMSRGLKLYKESLARMLLFDALVLGNELLNKVKVLPGVRKAELAGSLRRKKETIGDIDIVVEAEQKDWKKVVAKFVTLEGIERVLAKGNTRASIILKQGGVQVDVRVVEEQQYGSALFYFTGSKEHNIKLRNIAKGRGWKMNEYGVFDEVTGKRLAGTIEKDIYDLFDMQYVPPELREERGEIEEAVSHTLPHLVEEADVRGDMQMHSNSSDGAEDIETIASFILANYPAYEYIVITDHSPNARVAKGMKTEEFLKQFEKIDRVNRNLGKRFIMKGVEVDILNDGTLDLPDDLLGQFDWVTASIHSGFTKDNTQRLVNACRHPYVHCIGHPGGRLIGKRIGYKVNWKELFEKAATTGTAIEINAQPARLDLRDELVKDAIKQGVKMTVSTDAHALNQYQYMSLGIAVARRGWCTANDVLNTYTWDAIEDFKRSKVTKRDRQILSV